MKKYLFLLVFLVLIFFISDISVDSAECYQDICLSDGYAECYDIYCYDLNIDCDSNEIYNECLDSVDENCSLCSYCGDSVCDGSYETNEDSDYYCYQDCISLEPPEETCNYDNICDIYESPSDCSDCVVETNNQTHDIFISPFIFGTLKNLNNGDFIIPNNLSDNKLQLVNSQSFQELSYKSYGNGLLVFYINQPSKDNLYDVDPLEFYKVETSFEYDGSNFEMSFPFSLNSN